MINKETYNKLGVTAFKTGKFNEAVENFNNALKMDPFYKEAIQNYSFLLRELNLIKEAAPYLEKALKKYPEDKDIRRLFEESNTTGKSRKKIAILCLPGLQSFLGEIVSYLETKYEVITCYSNNNQEIESAISRADTVWLEWANELTISLTNHPTLLNGKHVICRLHSYEALAGYAKDIKWEKISDLMFVAVHIKDIVLQQAPDLLNRVKRNHLVPNGINLIKFKFKEREPGFNLAFVGYINFKKGPMLLLHAFRELVQFDTRYKLFIAGSFQDTRYELYFSQMIREMNLQNNIHFDGWVENIAAWLEDKQYIVSTSVLEGHPVGTMEAMARGLKPIIHNYVGARGTYPEKYLWNTIPEFVSMVRDDDYKSFEYRQFIETHYTLNKQLNDIKQILKQASK